MRVAQLQSVRFVIADLGGNTLGLADTSTIHIDDDAAGNGWYVDRTPMSDEEFSAANGSALEAVAVDVAKRVDLLTAVEHEMGHILGLNDLDSTLDDLMNPMLQVGIRRNASHAEVDALFADNAALDKMFARV